MLLIVSHTKTRHNHSPKFVVYGEDHAGGTSDIGDFIGYQIALPWILNYDPEIGRGQYRNHLAPSLLASSEPRYRDSGEVILERCGCAVWGHRLLWSVVLTNLRSASTSTE